MTGHGRQPSSLLDVKPTGRLDAGLRNSRRVRIVADRHETEVHKLRGDNGTFVEGLGIHYETTCGHSLRSSEGAVRTTREVTCTRCGAPTRAELAAEDEQP